MRWSLRLLGYARSEFGRLLALVATISAGVLLDVLKPWPMKLILDSVIANRPLPPVGAWLRILPGAGAQLGLLAWLTSATVLLFVGAWLLRLSQSYLETSVGSRMTFALGGALFDHLQKLSLRFHYRHGTGDLVKRVMNDCSCVRELVISVIVPMLTSVVGLCAMFVIMLRMDAMLAIVAIVAAPLLAVCVRVFSGSMEQRTYEQYELQGEIMSLAEQTLTALPVVRAFGREDHQDECFIRIHQKSDRAYLRALVAQLKFKVSADTVLAVGTAAVLALGGYHVLTGRLTAGSLLVFMSYLTSLYSPLETLAYLSQSYASAGAAARRLFEVFEVQDHVAEGARSIAGSRGSIRFDHVSFGYDPDRPVLHDVDLDVRAGETIAIVGETGAGKSTLISLLARFFDPTGGRVFIDGIDIRELSLASLREQIAVVLQEPFLFPLSVAENIAYGRPDASRDEVIAAAKAAQADRFIERLPEGYDTVIGERGATLSGGERQRLSIARALLKNAPVLILDEPTSAIDAQTEAAMMAALERLIENGTTLIIAHRLSTVRRADRIVVLEHGRVAEIGGYEELSARGGLFARLKYLQTGVVQEEGATVNG